jgi:glucose uptake protein
MILPQTHLVALLLMIASILCWGLWANTLKMGGRWRYELYYFDFAIGLGLAAVLFSLTVGNIGFDGFSLQDDLMHAGKRQWLYAFGAGVLFNFANELLVGAISVAGMAAAFPVGIGLALVMGALLNQVTRPGGSVALLIMGCALVIGAVALAASAYAIMGTIQREAQARAGKTRDTRRRLSLKGIFLAMVSGLFMGTYFPLVQRAQDPDVGLGPYATTLVFAVGVVLSTCVFNMFFVNLPVEGQPVEIWDYFRVRPRTHLLGILGGALWCSGAVANFVSSSAPVEVQISPNVAYAAAQGSALLAAFCGLAIWKEHKGADMRVKLMTFLVFLFYGGGLALILMAPARGVRGH